MNELEKHEYELLPQEKEELPEHEDAGRIVSDIHKHVVLNEVKTNKSLQDKFIGQARRTVEHELDTLNQESILKRQRVTYDVNREACRLYGIEHMPPLWQVWLMKIGAGFWFLIYWVFATLTIAPINIFFKGIKTFIRNNILVLLLAILCYLIIVVGIPLFIRLI